MGNFVKIFHASAPGAVNRMDENSKVEDDAPLLAIITMGTAVANLGRQG
jgi:hypothetical protein